MALERYFVSEAELLVSVFAVVEEESGELLPESLFVSAFFSDDPPSPLDSPEAESPDFVSAGFGIDWPFPFA